MTDKPLPFDERTIREIVRSYPTPFYIYDESAIRASAIEQSPLRHVAQPQDVARVIALLCGDDAGFLTGNVIRMR